MELFVFIFLLMVAAIAGIWGITTLRKGFKGFEEATAKQNQSFEAMDKAMEDSKQKMEEINPMLEFWLCSSCQMPNFVDEVWVKKYGFTDVDKNPLGDRCLQCFNKRQGFEIVVKMRKMEYQLMLVQKVPSAFQKTAEAAKEMQKAVRDDIQKMKDLEEDREDDEE